MFHVVVKGGVIYLCTTPANFRKNRAFTFLDEVSTYKKFIHI